jgi:2-oxoglutarate ferredoxin oxidoreductase subunit delta
MAKGTIRIDRQRCKGCSLCALACPQEIIRFEDSLNLSGYHPVVLVDPQSKCTGCALCAMVCPDLCITVYREARARKPMTA